MELSGFHAPSPAVLPPGKEPFTNWMGGLVGPGAGRDVLEKRKISCLSGFERRTVQGVALYLHRLSYPGYMYTVLRIV